MMMISLSLASEPENFKDIMFVTALSIHARLILFIVIILCDLCKAVLGMEVIFLNFLRQIFHKMIVTCLCFQ